ncbi:MAG: phosphohistidine phosphatase SixA [Halothiobacillaceae bacterium]|jgi:phosphohistidine phosphatase|nr:MAG: phosphohistidine phosphatase SixA [Halothiobacillaceae bacterium]
MQLILIRHAPAGDRVEWALTGQPDDERPLTKKGSAKMRDVAQGLARIFAKPRRVFSSPLLRARQTADILLEAYAGGDVELAPDLEPEADPQATLRWLKTLKNPQSVALVGHEPHLSSLLALLVHGDADLETMPFRKGGVAILEIDDLHPGAARLKALLPPDILRTLA